MGPAVAAPDHVLNAAGIEQTVLRAQPPTTLGPWRQRSYNRWAIGDARINPSVCSSLNGSRYRLPFSEEQTDGLIRASPMAHLL